MTTTCYFCGDVRTAYPYHVNGPHWTGAEYIRVDYCSGCASQVAAYVRPKREPRPRQVVATDWNMLAAFYGAGRKGERK